MTFLKFGESFNLLTRAYDAAHDAAQLLYDNHHALGLDSGAIKLDTLRADIAMELETRGKPVTPTADDPPTGAGE